jgi:colicin import membrane protein
MTAPRLALLLLTVRRIVLSALVVAAPAASAATAVEPSASAASTDAAEHADERARIGQERAAAEARFISRERACRQRFIVTSCLNDAKAERRQAIDSLRARQLALDEARRHERAELRRAELAEKSSEDARRERARPAHAPASAASAASPPIGTPFEKGRAEAAKSAASGAHGTPGGARPSAAGIGIKPQPQESKAAREQREAASRAAFVARQAEAAIHRSEAIERTTKRMAQKSPAAQLPPPVAASATSASAPRP